MTRSWNTSSKLRAQISQFLGNHARFYRPNYEKKFCSRYGYLINKQRLDSDGKRGIMYKFEKLFLWVLKFGVIL